MPAPAQCASAASSRPVGPQVQVSRSRQSGTRASSRARSSTPCSSSRLRLSARRPSAAYDCSSPAKMTSDAVGAQCTWATSASSPRWLRSMPMTGVMPLPAVRKSTFAGAGLGRVKSPVAWSSMTRVPGAVARTRWLRDLAVGDRLGGDRDAPRRDAGRGRAVGAVGEAVGAPVAHAVDVDADADVLPGHVAEPAAARADDDRHGIRGLGAHLDDAAAQVGAGAQRVDQVEVVARHERGGQRLGDLAGTTEHAPERTGGVGSDARARRRGRRVHGGRGRSGHGGCAHVRQRNLRERNLRNRNHAILHPPVTHFPRPMPGDLHLRTATCSGANA